MSGMIFKKLLRDIRNTIGQFLSMVIVLAVGCFFFAGMTESGLYLKRGVERYYERTALLPLPALSW